MRDPVASREMFGLDTSPPYVAVPFPTAPRAIYRNGVRYLTPSPPIHHQPRPASIDSETCPVNLAGILGLASFW
jgi:hypothetical protein